jgi:peptidoglycan/LPS O-acetylase OafA/YrhL
VTWQFFPGQSDISGISIPGVTRTLPSLATGRSLFDLFDAHRNSLNAIRLALAVLVIVSHSWPLGGYGLDPGAGGQSIGDWAVAGFFTISGFLITGSRVHSRSIWDYLWRRFLRIYPAFLAVLIVIAGVFAPISVWLTGAGGEHIGSAVGFVINNAALYLRQNGIDVTLASTPWPTSWDGPLWTLTWEFACYIGMGLLVTFVKNRRALIASVTTVFVLCSAATLYMLERGDGGNVTRLGAFFAAGALIYFLRRRIRLSPWIAAIALVLLIAIVWTGMFKVLGGLPLAYLLLYAGAVLPAPFQRIGAKNDISYGMYIYAWPVQQILAILFAHTSVPVWVFVVLSIALTVPLAWASWLLIERPAMKLKKLTAKRPVDIEGHVVTSARS